MDRRGRYFRIVIFSLHCARRLSAKVQFLVRVAQRFKQGSRGLSTVRLLSIETRTVRRWCLHGADTKTKGRRS